ncbi:MAG: 4Fe-4S binding protein [Chloroflexi bacterium]|nr:4Fe-4S binding protein [Chloroflexota bacterium]
MTESVFEIITYPEKCVACSTCLLRCSYRFTKTFNPARSAILIDPYEDTAGAAITFTSECDACGICARNCPYGALEARKKGGGHAG